MIYFSSEGSACRRRLDFWPYHLESLRRPRVLYPAHASDEVQRIPIQTPVFQMRVVNVNGNDLADHQAAAGRLRRKIENLMKLALKADRRLGNSLRPHDLRRLWSNLRQFELVHGRGVFAAGQIHRLAKFVGNEVD